MDQDCLTKARPPDRFQKLYRKLVQQVQRLQLVNNRALLLKKVFQLLNKWLKCLPNWTFFLVLLFLFHSAKANCDYGKASDCPLFQPVEKSTALYEGSVKVGHLKINTKDYVLKLYMFASSQPYNCENASEARPEQTCKVALWKNATCPGFNLERDGNRMAVMRLNVTEAFSYCSFIFGPNDYHVDQGGVILESMPPAPRTVEESKSLMVFLSLCITLLLVIVLIGLGFVVYKAYRNYKKRAQPTTVSTTQTSTVSTTQPTMVSTPKPTTVSYGVGNGVRFSTGSNGTSGSVYVPLAQGEEDVGAQG